jgi:hypothetical protein
VHLGTSGLHFFFPQPFLGLLFRQLGQTPWPFSSRDFSAWSLVHLLPCADFCLAESQRRVHDLFFPWQIPWVPVDFGFLQFLPSSASVTLELDVVWDCREKSVSEKSVFLHGCHLLSFVF